MRHLLKTAAILGGLSISLGASTAQAGGCGIYGQGPAPDPACQTQVVVHPGMTPYVDPMNVYSTQPMGHLKTVDFIGTPSVNIMRVHGMGPTAGLSDVPTGFTDGCMPESTGYCRSGGMMAAPAPMPAPAPIAMPMHMAPPMVAMPAPVMAPPAPRIVAIGGGYDPSKFIPRTYGSNELTPGIAHIPTSIVDRSHENAHAVLNSGMTQPQPIISGGMVPYPSMASHHGSSQIVQHGSIAPVASAPQGMSLIGSVNHSVQMAPEAPVYPGSMGGDGTYWEQVSGATTLGGMQATQVICKRQAPVVNVQRPVVGVPTAVPMGCYNNMPTMAGGHY